MSVADMRIMADWWTITGWAGTFAFGGLSVLQIIRDIKQGGMWRERAKSLIAIKKGLVQLRAMLTEAGDTERVIKSESGKQFLNSVGHQVRAIEHHIDGMLGD